MRVCCSFGVRLLLGCCSVAARLLVCSSARLRRRLRLLCTQGELRGSSLRNIVESCGIAIHWQSQLRTWLLLMLALCWSRQLLRMPRSAATTVYYCNMNQQHHHTCRNMCWVSCTILEIHVRPYYSSIRVLYCSTINSTINSIRVLVLEYY